MISARREFAGLKAKNQFLLVDEKAARETIRSLEQLKIETPRELFTKQRSTLEASMSRSTFQIVKVPPPNRSGRLSPSEPTELKLDAAAAAITNRFASTNNSTLKNMSVRTEVRGSAYRREELFAEKYVLPQIGKNINQFQLSKCSSLTRKLQKREQ